LFFTQPQSGLIQELKDTQGKEGPVIECLVPPHQPVSKICVCGTATPELTFKLDQCSNCDILLCMFPRRNFRGKHHTASYQH